MNRGLLLTLRQAHASEGSSLALWLGAGTEVRTGRGLATSGQGPICMPNASGKDVIEAVARADVVPPGWWPDQEARCRSTMRSVPACVRGTYQSHPCRHHGTLRERLVKKP